MRPNLSVASFAAALAVLGSSALIVGCGAADAPRGPVEGKEVTPVKRTDPVPVEGQCGADNRCGANKLGGSGCGSTGAGCGGSAPGSAGPASTPANPDAG